MTLIDVTKMTEDEAKKCSLPNLLHKGMCTRKTWAVTEEDSRIWKEYRDMIKLIVVGLKSRKIWKISKQLSID